MNLPEITFKCRVAGEWMDKTTDDFFKGKRVVLFALPGAFTPTCSSKQLPKYEEMYDQFINKGVSEIYCLSVNDGFVMNAWADNLNVEKVKMIPDGSGEKVDTLGKRKRLASRAMVPAPCCKKCRTRRQRKS